jgi:hypothetical protein
MKGMGRLWQAAGTAPSVLRPGLLEKAVACGLRSLFEGDDFQRGQICRSSLFPRLELPYIKRMTLMEEKNGKANLGYS